MDPSSISNPPLTASPVGAIFFPQRPQLHLGDREFSPDFQRKILETVTRTTSYAAATGLIKIWSEQTLCSRTVNRLTDEIGAELVAERNATVDDFTHHRRQPAGVDPKHALAAVFVDGGRVQTREEPSDPGVHGKRWVEDKIARLQTMARTTFAVDPCPELPRCFHQPVLHAVPVPSVSPEQSSDFFTWLDSESSVTPPPRWQPKPLIRTCVATMKPLEAFRWMVQAEAKRRHFFTANAKAFVADGTHGNWTLWQRHFSDFVPILDFVHAAEYLHAAAKALGSSTLGVSWTQALWSGRSVAVIAELTAACVSRGVGEGTLEESHPLFALQRATVYLSNASDKLDYPRYRRLGLPVTSSLIESQIKEFNRRVKGSEKFWSSSRAEGMLELVSRMLNDDGESLEGYFTRRPTSALRNGDPKTVA
jgi:hypothetical protein